MAPACWAGPDPHEAKLPKEEGGKHVESVIGENAGRIWQLLREKGPQSPSAVTKALNLKSAEVDRSIGWLAREGKLAFEADPKGYVKIALK
jgi:hypothetical protein